MPVPASRASSIRWLMSSSWPSMHARRRFQDTHAVARAGGDLGGGAGQSGKLLWPARCHVGGGSRRQAGDQVGGGDAGGRNRPQVRYAIAVKVSGFQRRQRLAFAEV